MSISHLAEKVYPRLPPILQNVVCSAYGLKERGVRHSDYFWTKLDELRESDRVTRAAITSRQDRSIAELIDHAYGTVPYYRRVMQARGLVPADITTRQDLRKLPILTKDLIRQNVDALVSSKTRRSELLKSKTSGTTGSALHFLTTRHAIAFQWAVWWRHRSRFGVAPNASSLNFTGKPVVPASQSRPPFWRWNYPMNQALINMSQVVPAKIGALVDFVNAHTFEFYSGYPSIISAFCTAVAESGLKVERRPRVAFLGAEPVLDSQRKLIEEVLACTVTDQYGFSEGCGNASRCEHGFYHEDWEFCALEPTDPEVWEDGGSSGILATGFANDGFPFIRYEVGDVGCWAPPSFHCACGRESRGLFSVSGRDEDYVVTPEGARVMRFDYVFKDTESIREAQVRQDMIGEITVVYVSRSDTRDAESERKVLEGVRKYVSPGLTVKFEVVRAIPRASNGKFRSVVSSLGKSVGRVAAELGSAP